MESNPFDLKKVADLARLTIPEEKISNMERAFAKILDDFASLNEVNTDQVEPMVTPHDQQPSLRVDEVFSSLSTEQALANAPDEKDQMFRVPPVVS